MTPFAVYFRHYFSAADAFRCAAFSLPLMLHFAVFAHFADAFAAISPMPLCRFLPPFRACHHHSAYYQAFCRHFLSLFAFDIFATLLLMPLADI